MLVRSGKKKYILRPGTKVQIDNRAVFSVAKEPNWVDAEVVDTLSLQFTSELEDGSIQYRMYRDIDSTWKPTQDSI